MTSVKSKKRQRSLEAGRLRLEQLENRKLMAACSVGLNNGVVQIEGTHLADAVTVADQTFSGAGMTFTAKKVDLQCGTGDTVQRTFPNFIWSIDFKGHAGNDRFVNNTSVPSTVVGGSGNDTLFGGHGSDSIFSGAGNELVYGRDGNDFLDGGEGIDWLYGNGGDDSLFGSGGNDRLTAMMSFLEVMVTISYPAVEVTTS